MRLLLVDTPETKHPREPVEPYGPEASQFAKDTLSGKEVKLEFDGPKRDKYDRLLVHLWIGDKTFNQMLLENGFARIAYVYDPPYNHYDAYLEAEEKAKNSKIGIWSIPNYVQNDGFNEAAASSDSSSTTDTGTSDETINTSQETQSVIDLVSVDLGDEVVVIKNTGSSDIDLSGWFLLSVTGNQTYYFPEGYILESGATVKIVSGRGATDNPPSQLKWTGRYIWNNDGDPAELYNNDSELVDQAN
nr:hypothetical protein 2 [Bacillales bacterium]